MNKEKLEKLGKKVELIRANSRAVSLDSLNKDKIILSVLVCVSIMLIILSIDTYGTSTFILFLFILSLYLLLMAVVSYRFLKNNKERKKFDSKEEFFNHKKEEIKKIMKSLSFEELKEIKSKNYYDSELLKNEVHNYLVQKIANKLNVENVSDEFDLIDLSKEVNKNKNVIKNL